MTHLLVDVDLRVLDLPELRTQPTECGCCRQRVSHYDACARLLRGGEPVQGCEDGIHMHPQCWWRDERAQRLYHARIEEEQRRRLAEERERDPRGNYPYG